MMRKRSRVLGPPRRCPLGRQCFDPVYDIAVTVAGRRGKVPVEAFCKADWDTWKRLAFRQWDRYILACFQDLADTHGEAALGAANQLWGQFLEGVRKHPARWCPGDPRFKALLVTRARWVWSRISGPPAVPFSLFVSPGADSDDDEVTLEERVSEAEAPGQLPRVGVKGFDREIGPPERRALYEAVREARQKLEEAWQVEIAREPLLLHVLAISRATYGERVRDWPRITAELAQHPEGWTVLKAALPRRRMSRNDARNERKVTALSKALSDAYNDARRRVAERTFYRYALPVIEAARRGSPLLSDYWRPRPGDAEVLHARAEAVLVGRRQWRVKNAGGGEAAERARLAQAEDRLLAALGALLEAGVIFPEAPWRPGARARVRT